MFKIQLMKISRKYISKILRFLLYKTPTKLQYLLNESKLILGHISNLNIQIPEI